MKALPYVATGAAIALLGLGGLALLSSQPSISPEPASALAGDLLPSSSTATMDRGFTGVIVASESVDIAARMSGVVTEVRVRLGDKVAHDGLLATIDDRALRNELAMAQAALRAARSAEQKASLQLAEARERLGRWERTAKTAVVSPEELASMRYKAKYAAQEHGAAGARVAESQARVAGLERQIADAAVRAPFAGQVAMRYVDAGVTVQHGQPIVRLVRADELWIRFAIPEDRSAEIRAGQPVEVRIEDSAMVLSGVVEHVAPEIDAASRAILAEARLELPAEPTTTTLAGRVGRVHPRLRLQLPAP